ncbi:MAG: Gfo/Idh/MocA family oxidoreductase [bacterium]
MKPLRVGIIGAGKIARTLHAPGFKAAQGCVLTGVCSGTMEKAKTLAAEFDIPNIFKNYKLMIASKSVDAVAICTPNYLHAPVAIYALEHGVNVFVEKPMALSVKEIKKMISTATENKCLLAVNHNWRFNPAAYELRAQIQAGVIGKVESLRGKLGYSGFEHWRPGSIWFTDFAQSGGGASVDLGVHIYDLIRFVTGKEAQTIGAQMSSMTKGMKVDDNFTAVVKFTDGTTGEFEASWTARPSEMSMTLYGQKGKVVFDGINKTVEICIVDPAHPERVKKILKPKIPKKSPLGNPCGNFVKTCLGKEKASSSGKDAMLSTTVVLAGLRAAKTGRLINLKGNK